MSDWLLQRGEGKDLVFFHGYGASKESFLPQINYFSQFCRVTAFDFWGFGQNKPLLAAYSVEDYAQMTRELLHTLQITNPYVIAHSFGGRVAVKMQSMQPCFEKMVLTGAAGINVERGLRYYLKVWSYKTLKLFFPDLANSKFGSVEYKKLSPLEKESYKKIVNEDLREEAKKITIPTLLIYGKKDTITPIKLAKIYNKNIVNSRLEIIENTGHFSFLQNTLRFNTLTEEFLFPSQEFLQ